MKASTGWALILLGLLAFWGLVIWIVVGVIM